MDAVEADLQMLKTLLNENKREEIKRIQNKYKTVSGKSQESHWPNIETDELAATLLPYDLPVPNLRPLKTTGNGDCLFNAASLFLKDKLLKHSLDPRVFVIQ